METETQAQEQVLNPEVMRSSAPLARIDTNPLEVIEQRNKLVERVLELAIRATRPEHWFDQGGNPYLGGAGSEVVARRCGVKWSNVKREKLNSTDDKGTYYVWLVRGTFALPGAIDSVEAEGTCSSRDQFLGTETNAGREMSEIDEGNILKAAHTNMVVRGVTSLLGLRGLSWAFLGQYGISPDGVSKVTYSAGAKGGGTSKGGFTFKFGRGKDKDVSEVSDRDLDWYLGVLNEDLKNPEKARYKANTEKGVAAIHAEQERRKGTGKPKTMWARIQDLAADYEFPRGEKDADLIALVKKATKDKPGKDLDEQDFALVEAALADAVQASPRNDIPY